MSRPFHVVSGKTVKSILDSEPLEILRHVRSAYIAHHLNETVVPPSLFLRTPGRPDSRSIALPAYIRTTPEATGIKWISSNPKNHEVGLPRASGVVVLNDIETGYPVCVLEGSHISAARTGASAALAAESMGSQHSAHLGIIGAGIIAASTCRYLSAAKNLPSRVLVFDRDPARAGAFASAMEQRYGVTAYPSTLETALGCDLVAFATTAASPHIRDTHVFGPGQVVLNISLRDLHPHTILAASNILDDVDHCLKENTSPHLAEQMSGSRNFVVGTIGELLSGEVSLDPERAKIFSPFGLGALDIAIASWVFQTATRRGEATAIDEFF